MITQKLTDRITDDLRGQVFEETEHLLLHSKFTDTGISIRSDELLEVITYLENARRLLYGENTTFPPDMRENGVMPTYKLKECPLCHGEKIIKFFLDKRTCPECGGKGEVPVEIENDTPEFPYGEFQNGDQWNKDQTAEFLSLQEPSQDEPYPNEEAIVIETWEDPDEDELTQDGTSE